MFLLRKINTQQVQEILLQLMSEFHNFCITHNIKYYMIGGTLLGAVRHKGFIPWDDDIDVGMLRQDYEKFLALSSKFSKNYIISNYKTNKHANFPLTRIHVPGTYIKTNEPKKFNHALFLDVFPIDNVPNSYSLAKKHANKIRFYKNLLHYKGYIQSKNKIKNSFRKIVRVFLAPIRYNCIIAKMDRIFQMFANEDTACVCSMASQYSYEKQTMKREIYGEPILLPFDNYYFYAPQEPIKYLTQLYGEYQKLPSIEKRRPTQDVYLVD